MGLTGALSRSFLYGLNNIEVTGLEGFLDILDKRKDVDGRERGLITGTGMLDDYRGAILTLYILDIVSNHVSVYVIPSGMRGVHCLIIVRLQNG
jgi:hypothetical protein